MTESGSWLQLQLTAPAAVVIAATAPAAVVIAADVAPVTYLTACLPGPFVLACIHLVDVCVPVGSCAQEAAELTCLFEAYRAHDPLLQHLERELHQAHVLWSQQWEQESKCPHALSHRQCRASQ